jgi:hypothetical protein
MTFKAPALATSVKLLASLMTANLLSAPTALADCAGKACADVYIDRIYIQGQGAIFIGTSGNETLLNCTAVSSVYVTLDPSERNSDLMYAQLRDAQAEDKKVYVRIQENSSDCKIQHIIIDRR